MLVAGTTTYDVIEAVIAISAGAVAGSTALIGFGLDSVIEVSSATVVGWQFSGSDPSGRTALRLIGISSSPSAATSASSHYAPSSGQETPSRPR